MTYNQTREEMQESEYSFPYHHITEVSGDGFRLCRIMDWGTWGCAYTSYTRFIVRSLQNLKCRSVLDVGCGDGRLLKDLASVGIPDLAGIDVSERALHFARGFASRAEFVCGDITEKNQFDRRFDAITLIDTLEHLPPEILPRFISGVARYLEVDGHVLVTVPSVNLALQEKHYQHFDADSLKRILAPTFEVVECCFLNRIGLVNGLLRRVLANRLFILNSDRLLSLAYKAYERWCLLASAQNGTRVFALCKIRREPTG